mmetsp:Transcript_13349/g.11421  ORF Transcript_13349/g.11421 Transcript_13349/m.11421 type:complete len:298 (+) Transcript_13349:24-917(+)
MYYQAIQYDYIYLIYSYISTINLEIHHHFIMPFFSEQFHESFLLLFSIGNWFFLLAAATSSKESIATTSLVGAGLLFLGRRILGLLSFRLGLLLLEIFLFSDCYLLSGSLLGSRGLLFFFFNPVGIFFDSETGSKIRILLDSSAGLSEGVKSFLESFSFLSDAFRLAKKTKESLILVDFVIKEELHVLLSRSDKVSTNNLGDTVSNISANQTEVRINSVSQFLDKDHSWVKDLVFFLSLLGEESTLVGQVVNISGVKIVLFSLNELFNDLSGLFSQLLEILNGNISHNIKNLWESGK